MKGVARAAPRAAHALCKATILPAGGAEELPRTVTRQRHKRHAALDRLSVTVLHRYTSYYNTSFLSAYS